MPKKKFDKTTPAKVESEDAEKTTSIDTDNGDSNEPKKETEWKAPKFGVHPFYIGIDNSEISGAGTGTPPMTTDARKTALENSQYYPGLVDRLEAAGCLYPSAHQITSAERAAVTNMLLYATMRARLIGLGVEEIELHDEQAISLYPSTVSHLPLVSVHIGDTIRDKNDASCVAPECEVEKSYLWTGESGASVTTHQSTNPYGEGLFLHKVGGLITQGVSCMLGVRENTDLEPQSIINGRSACLSFLLNAAMQAVGAYSHALEGIDDRLGVADKLTETVRQNMFMEAKKFGNEPSKKLYRLSKGTGDDTRKALDELKKKGALAPPTTSLGFQLGLLKAYLRQIESMLRMNVNAMLRLDMLVEGDAFSDLDSLSERLVQLTSVAAFDASKFTADVDRDADLVARVRESYRTEVELGMQRCIKVPINIKLTVQGPDDGGSGTGTKVMVISADTAALKPYVGLVGTITDVSDPEGTKDKVKFTLEFDPKDNGGGTIRGTGSDKTGVAVSKELKWNTKVTGFQRKNLNSGVELLFSVNPLTEVLAAVLDGVPGGENWQLKIHTREPFATNGEGQVRLMFVFMHVEPEMEAVKDENGNPLAANGKVDKEKKPWENEPEAQQRVKNAATAVLTSHMDVIKNNIIKYIKSQVGSSVQKASAVDVTVGEVLAATYVEGYAYAPQLAYGPASDHSLGGVGSEWNRMRLEMQLNYPNEEKQLRVLRRMRDALLHEKDEGKFNERGQWTMVAKPSAYLVFTTGQLTGKSLTELIRRIGCFFSNFGATVGEKVGLGDKVIDARVVQTVRELVTELGELVHIETETDRVNHMEGTFQLQRLSYRDTSFLADSSLLPKVAVPETVEN